MSMGVFHPQDWAEGSSSGPRAPFGYQKSASKRSQLVPDPIAAITVRKIFELTANGMGVTAIVRYLNEKEIPTPIQYARAKGLTGNYDDGDGSWNSRSVKYILTNRTYTGMLIQGKEKRAVAGTHDALVDKNTFEAIQKGYTSQRNNVNRGVTRRYGAKNKRETWRFPAYFLLIHKSPQKYEVQYQTNLSHLFSVDGPIEYTTLRKMSVSGWCHWCDR